MTSKKYILLLITWMLQSIKTQYILVDVGLENNSTNMNLNLYFILIQLFDFMAFSNDYDCLSIINMLHDNCNLIICNTIFIKTFLRKIIKQQKTIL